jgi:phosphohistidine phosphatase
MISEGLMDIYLVRHGNAKPRAEDPQRGLTDLGKRQAEATARWTRQAAGQVSQIWHSGKRRAEQTAEIFARHLHPSRGVVTADGLSPNDDVSPVAELIEAENQPVMIVGHLPFLPGLASALVAGDPERVGFALMEAGVLCLHRREGRWFVRWMVTPGELGVRG